MDDACFLFISQVVQLVVLDEEKFFQGLIYLHILFLFSRNCYSPAFLFRIERTRFPHSIYFIFSFEIRVLFISISSEVGSENTKKGRNRSIPTLMSFFSSLLYDVQVKSFIQNLEVCPFLN